MVILELGNYPAYRGFTRAVWWHLFVVRTIKLIEEVSMNLTNLAATLDADWLRQDFEESAVAELAEAMRRMDSGAVELEGMCRRLECREEALRQRLERRADATEEGGGLSFTALEIGAGRSFIWNYLLLKSLLPDEQMRYVAVDVDAAAGRRHSERYRGKEIRLLVMDATHMHDLESISGLAAGEVDMVIVDRPVVCEPEDYLAMPCPSPGEDGKEESAGASMGPKEMQEMLRSNPAFANGIRRQKQDFEKIFSRTIPHFLKPGGLLLTSTLIPEEEPFLREILNRDPLKEFQSVCSS